MVSSLPFLRWLRQTDMHIARGLEKLTPEVIAQAMQVTPENPIDGLEGRTNLLIRLGDALLNQEIFGE